MCCMLSCVVKCFLIFFNLLLLLIGLLILAVGIVCLELGPILNQLLASLAPQVGSISINTTQLIAAFPFINIIGSILVAIGAVIVVVAILGIVGANCCCLIKIVLWIYVIILAVLLIVWLVGIIILYSTSDQFDAYAKNQLALSIAQNFVDIWQLNNQDNSVALMWNAVMTSLGCCGANSYTDYQASSQWNRTWTILQYNSTGSGYMQTVQAQIPVSCCILTPSASFGSVASASSSSSSSSSSSNGQTTPLNPVGTLLNDPWCPNAPTTGNSYMSTSCYDAAKSKAQEYITIMKIVLGVITLIFAVPLVLAIFVIKYSGKIFPI